MSALEEKIKRFKFALLRQMPFYGDIVMRLQFIEDRSIETAATNGTNILYNPAFLERLSGGAQNFVWMHEIFHILLFHCRRRADRDPDLWNVACDMVVNSMLTNLMRDMRRCGIPFEQPPVGVFSSTTRSDTVENIYAALYKKHTDFGQNSQTVFIRTYGKEQAVEVFPDLIAPVKSENNKKEFRSLFPKGKHEKTDLNQEDTENAFAEITVLIKEAAAKNRGTMGSFFVPDSLLQLTRSRRLNWKTLLRNFFTEIQSDEASYTTPERKYIHMDLILPGYGKNKDEIEEIWAFVDSSGSIDKNTAEQFLTQLYRICKEFHCKLHICYWDTEVTDIYRNIAKEKDVLNCMPHHSGGTDINCVYRWLKENKEKPDVMLILTDGYFGTVQDKEMLKRYRRKTIVVLSTEISTENVMEIGKLARL